MQKRVKIEPLSIIVAVDQQGGFGKNGKIPWDIPSDMKHFHQTTKDSICLMGWNTYQDMYNMRLSKSKKKKQKNSDLVYFDKILPNRESYVITSKYQDQISGATAVSSIRKSIYNIDKDDKREVFVLGGYRMFLQAFPWTHKVYMSIIKDTYDCDRFFPLKYLKQHFKIVDGSENDDAYFLTYQRIK